MADKYVKIQSGRNIQVTKPLGVREGGAIDATNKNLRLENRFRINPTWQKETVLIKEGTHVYDAKIAKWNSVKVLEEKGILTIAGYCNEKGEKQEDKPHKKAVEEEIKFKTTVDELSNLVK